MRTIIKSIWISHSLDFFKVSKTIIFCLLFGTSLAIAPQLKNAVTSGQHFYFIFTSSILVFMSGAILLIKRNMSYSQEMNWTDVFVIVYLIYVFLNTIFHRNTSLQDSVLIELVMLTFVYFISKIIFSKNNYLLSDVVIFSFLVCGFIQASLGILQLADFKVGYHSPLAVSGSFFNPAPFSGYLISIFPMTLAIYHFSIGRSVRQKILRYTGLITALFILVIIPFSQSRASWIALITSGIFVYGRHYNFTGLLHSLLKNKIRKVAFLAFSIAFVISSATYLFSWKTDSALGRVLIWEVTLDMIVDKPFFGVGLNQYSPNFGQQQAAYFQSDKYTTDKAMLAGKGEYAFNEFLQITAEQGILGLILFIGMIFFSFRNSIFQKGSVGGNQRVLITGASGGLVALLVFSLFSYPFSITPLLLNFYFLLSILSAGSRNKVSIAQISLGKKPWRYLALACLPICCYWVVSNQKEKYEAMATWKTAARYKSKGDYKVAMEMMNQIEPVLSHNGDFMFEYGQTCALNRDNHKGIEILEKASQLTSDPYLFNSLGNCYQRVGNFEKAEEAYIHAFFLIPHKLYPRYLLAKLYIEMGETKKAIELAQQIINMEVKIPSKAVNQMKAEMADLIKMEMTSE